MSKEDLIQEVIENIARCQRPSNLAGRQKLGLSYSQVSMLYMLHYHKQLQVKQVADYLSVTKSAASQMLDSLSTKGLVDRRADIKDRRIVRFSLSGGGIKTLKNLNKLRFSSMRTRLEGLSQEELMTLATVVRKMSAVQIKN